MRKLLTILPLIAVLSACATVGKVNYDKKFGLYVEHDGVSTFCLVPSLRLALGAAQSHFRKPVVVTSGYRNPFHNARVNGAKSSLHMSCRAADFFIPGVSKRDLINFMKRQGQIGGIGCYPGRKFIHVDVRDRPRGYRQPVMFSGC